MGQRNIVTNLVTMGLIMMLAPINVLANTQCGGTFPADAESGVMTSPNYPYSYGDNERCEWSIPVPDGFVIRLTFYPPFEVEDNYDFLKVWETGSSNSSRTWTGKTVPPVYTSGTNTTMEIRFTSDRSGASKGFSVTWERLALDDIQCGHDFSRKEKRGFVTSPNYPNAYEINQQCRWRIPIPEGSSIRLTLYSPFDLGEHDMLELYGNTTSGTRQRVRHWAGSYSKTEVYTSNPDINMLELLFTSDGASVDAGFSVFWERLALNDTRCGWTFPATAEGGVISSPGYPDRYLDQERCRWDIHVPVGYVIKLAFYTPFYLEPKYDFLKAIEISPSGTRNETQSWSGFVLPPDFTSTTNHMELWFTSDVSNGENGFSLSWEKVVPLLPCNYSLVGSSGVISSPRDLDRYEGPHCWWNVQVPLGQFIRIEFRWTADQSHQKLSDHQKWLEVYDITGNGSMIRRGRWGGADPPPNLKSFGSRMAIRLTNNEGEGRGPTFMANWRAVRDCGGSLTADEGYVMSHDYDLEGNFDVSYGGNTSVQEKCVFDISVPRHLGITLNVELVGELWNGSKCEILQIMEYSERDARYVTNQDWCRNAVGNSTRNVTSYSLASLSTEVTFSSRSLRLVYDARIDDTGGFFASWKSGNVCGERLTAERGSLTTPNFPGDYDTGLDCRWEIHADPNHMVKMRFDHTFQVEGGDESTMPCPYDYVEIFDTDGSQQISRGRFCGSRPPSDLISYFSPVVVVFHSDGSKSGAGFSLSWNSEDTCGGVFTRNQGNLSYPNIDAPYPITTNCRWEIHVDPWFETVVLDMEGRPGHFDYDLVQIWLNPGGGRGMNFMGNVYLSNHYTGTLPGSSFVVVFKARDTTRRQGIDLSWRAGCGGHFSESKGNLSSPNYGVTYPTNIDCDWAITATRDHVIHLNFDSSFDIETSNDDSCSFDYVEVLDYTTSGQQFSHGRFCGSQAPPALISSSNTVEVRFHSDEGKTGKGFSLAWDEACGEVFQTREGNVTTPNYPSAYPHNFDCRWEIRVPTGYIIRLRFREPFRMEENSFCTADYVELYDYTATGSAVKKGRWCGNDVPPLQSSLTSRMMLVFHSDNKKNYPGFRAEWDSVCGDVFNYPGGSFSSPGFPHSYPDNLNCRWEINVAEGYRVELTFGSTFDIEMDRNDCGYDNIEILDFLPNGTLISSGRWCSVRETPVFHSTSSRLLVTFTSDLDKSGHGFTASWRTVSGCGDTFTSPTGYLLTPNFPNKYPENRDCRWEISPPSGTNITLHFDPLFDVELSNGCNWDNVKILLGNTQLGNWCGDKAPPDVQVEGGQRLEVIFHSDNSNSGKGFYASWTENHNN